MVKWSSCKGGRECRNGLQMAVPGALCTAACMPDTTPLPAAVDTGGPDAVVLEKPVALAAETPIVLANPFVVEPNPPVPTPLVLIEIGTLLVPVKLKPGNVKENVCDWMLVTAVPGAGTAAGCWALRLRTRSMRRPARSVGMAEKSPGWKTSSVKGSRRTDCACEQESWNLL